MKYVYVLTSSPKDIYYEQFYLSAVSLRLFNPTAHIILLVDQKTKDTLVEKRSNHEKTISETKVLSVPSEYTQKEVSRWIKTSISEYVSGSFLYIDCDTIITDKLDFNFPPGMVIGAVLDTHTAITNHHLRDVFRNDNQRLGFDSITKIDKYFNGGLIYCRNCADGKKFFAKWHDLWIKSRNMGNSQDMPSFNQANYECDNIIAELDGSWNCQISHNGIPYLFSAKIIHYFATSLTSFEPPFMLASNEILKSIKKSGEISPDIIKLLHNPRAAFLGNTRLISDQVIFDILESAFFSKLLWLRRNHHKIFKILNNIINRIKKPGFKKRGFRAQSNH
jgi:hypothetical protein